jgi:hypothetical protein
MARRKRVSLGDVFNPVFRALLCGGGLLGGLALGGFVIFISGLWNRLDRVLGMSLSSASMSELIMAGAAFAVVIGCGWLGTRYGMILAARRGD